MKRNEDILLEVSRGLAEVRNLLKQVDHENSRLTAEMGELLRACEEIESDLRQKNINFMTLLVDTATKLAGATTYKVVQHPDSSGQRYYFFFIKGSTTVGVNENYSTDVVDYPDFGYKHFEFMRSRLVTEVVRMLKNKPDGFRRCTKLLNESLAAILNATADTIETVK